MYHAVLLILLNLFPYFSKTTNPGHGYAYPVYSVKQRNLMILLSLFLQQTPFFCDNNPFHHAHALISRFISDLGDTNFFLVFLVFIIFFISFLYRGGSHSAIDFCLLYKRQHKGIGQWQNAISYFSIHPNALMILRNGNSSRWSTLHFFCLSVCLSVFVFVFWTLVHRRLS